MSNGDHSTQLAVLQRDVEALTGDVESLRAELKQFTRVLYGTFVSIGTSAVLLALKMALDAAAR